MSKENAIRFKAALDKDEALKNAYLNMMDKYEGKRLSDDEWNKIMQEEVIPFAKERGYDFDTEELGEPRKQAEKLSDDELDLVTGGSAQFTHVEEKNGGVFRVTSRCEMLDRKEFFVEHYLFNNCTHYEWNGSGSDDKKCACCASFCYDWEVEYLGKSD